MRTKPLGTWIAILAMAGAPSRADPPGEQATPDAGRRLGSLVAAYWDEELRRDPIEATFRGERRYGDRLPDFSWDAREARYARLRAILAEAAGIDATVLGPDERVELELLRYVLEDRLAGEPFNAELAPINQRGGFHLDFAASAEFQPRETRSDFENYLSRLRAFPRAVDDLAGLLRRGVAEGRVPPRVAMAKVASQLRAMAAARAEEGPFWAVVAGMPGDWPEGERREWAGRIRDAIERDVAPACVRLAEFVEAEYLPACRESVGLWAAPDGPAHYAHLVRSCTTTDLTPDEVHSIGLAEVARAREAMEAIRRRVGFDGDLAAFFAQVRTDPRWRAPSEEWMLARYRSILDGAEARLPELFGRLPRTAYVLRKVEPYRYSTAPGGSYSSAPPDGSRPAYFHVNVCDPTGRTTYDMQALVYHEVIPGHHLQLSLAKEVPGRSAFRRNAHFAAFVEGWALYCEGLADELGLYEEPYAEFGRLKYDALRSARLVIDTGLHHGRWSRERAIAYLESVCSDPRPRIEAEVDRCIIWPGYGLSYKVGERKIREIRSRAERLGGESFDIRAFHDRLLSCGALPLGLLERVMQEGANPACSNEGP